jgi:dihydrodipicolinate synthase/N-acetylneuraminate lyase
MNPPTPEPASSILATAVVPWTASGAFDSEIFCRQVRTIARGLTRHIYLFGTAGEGYAVTERQFDEIASCFAAVAREEKVRPMLGLISLSLPTIIERIERSRGLGFREFQLSLPSWGALNDAELVTFFAETCGRFPDCSFHHYNLARTKRLLTAVDYRQLVGRHPNFVAVKSSADDPAVVADLLTMSPRLRFYFTEFGYAIARRTHEVGLLASLSTAHYDRAKLFVAGDDAARSLDLADFRAMIAAIRELATGRMHMDGAFDKMLIRLSDPAFPLHLLPPYASATEPEFARFRAALPARWRMDDHPGLSDPPSR